MKIAIMQPTYIPWSGYFNLIANVDRFVFLDDVQFEKRSWQQRNRILLNGEATFLTIPVMSKGKHTQLINECFIDNSQKWNKTHIQTIKHAYGKHPYGPEVIEVLESYLQSPDDKIINLLIPIISEFCRRLGIETPFSCSSSIPLMGKKSEYLLGICNYYMADKYLSAASSRQYIVQEALFLTSSVDVEYQNFVPVPYTQVQCNEFVSHLSIVDVVANLGFKKTAEYIQ